MSERSRLWASRFGALSTAFGLVFAKVVELPGWQLPLVIVGVMLAISLPSMVIAWLKLRQRTIAPMLEANGWAINGRVKVNIPFGTALTERALLPSNAKRTLHDPYEDKDAARRRRMILLLLLLVAVAFRFVGITTVAATISGSSRRGDLRHRRHRLAPGSRRSRLLLALSGSRARTASVSEWSRPHRSALQSRLNASRQLRRVGTRNF